MDMLPWTRPRQLDTMVTLVTKVVYRLVVNTPHKEDDHHEGFLLVSAAMESKYCTDFKK